MNKNMSMPHKKKMNRYSISVSRKTYDRLQAATLHGSLASCVDEIVMDVLEDPAALAQLVAKCRVRVEYS